MISTTPHDIPARGSASSGFLDEIFPTRFGYGKVIAEIAHGDGDTMPSSVNRILVHGPALRIRPWRGKKGFLAGESVRKYRYHNRL